MNIRCLGHVGAATCRRIGACLVVRLHLALARLRFDICNGDSKTDADDNEVKLDPSQLDCLRE